jgi:nitrite reductase/ring-hydroxylating ferredoxin subunit
MVRVQLCLADDVTEDEPYQAIIGGYEPFAVFRVNGAIFVMEDRCNHSGASLSLGGRVEGFNIICGWHEATFDVRSGAPIGGPCTGPMRAHPAIIDDGHVWIEL